MILEKLLGNRSAAEILLFLLINQKSYPSQVARSLSMPLTPLQKAFDRLEKGGVLTSYFEGRTKLYEMNPNYPLKMELLNLLQKSFAILPPEKKERYPFVVPHRPQRLHNPYKTLKMFWKCLSQISSATLRVKQGEKSLLHGRSRIEIRAQENRMIFQEEGMWESIKGHPMTYRNALRWSFHYTSQLISLEHLRFGENDPVFLFYLYPKDATTLESATSHLCGDDTYFGRLSIDAHHLTLLWKTIGPEKNETIEATYGRM